MREFAKLTDRGSFNILVPEPRGQGRGLLASFPRGLVVRWGCGLQQRVVSSLPLYVSFRGYDEEGCMGVGWGRKDQVRKGTGHTHFSRSKSAHELC